MTEVTRRERLRAATDSDIRRQARQLLTEHGRDAVTLRAIARELGMTAPALYRYYDSREELLARLCDDIAADLTGELHATATAAEEQFRERIFGVCRAFRQWALAHPREFALVFATPPGEGSAHQDRFAGIFLGIVAPFMTEGSGQDNGDAPPALDLPDLSTHQRALQRALEAEGLPVPAEVPPPDMVYFLLRWWVRLYGHIALEVFGRFPFDLHHADRLFEALLTEMADDIGLA